MELLQIQPIKDLLPHADSCICRDLTLNFFPKVLARKVIGYNSESLPLSSILLSQGVMAALLTTLQLYTCEVHKTEETPYLNILPFFSLVNCRF